MDSENHAIRRLPDNELEVMQAIWSLEPPARRADIELAMKDVHPMAQTTLLTHLTRLADKGFIIVEKQGRSSAYTPLVSRREYLAARSRSFIDKICGGSMSAFATALNDIGLSREEMEELRRLLEGREL